MITLDVLFVFLVAASLPIIYIFILSRWLEPAYRQAHPELNEQKARPTAKREVVTDPPGAAYARPVAH